MRSRIPATLIVLLIASSIPASAGSPDDVSLIVTYAQTFPPAVRLYWTGNPPNFHVARAPIGPSTGAFPLFATITSPTGTSDWLFIDSSAGPTPGNGFFYQVFSVSCTDGVMNGDETDVDCGGSCNACVDGAACTSSADCASKHCDLSVCQIPTCSDNQSNSDETDVDCGGSCASKCAADRKCNSTSDCDTVASLFCSRGYCIPTHCTNTTLDGGETAVDCGGPCGACQPAQACNTGSDCTSGLCSAVCLDSSCSDSVQNDTETDVDCGGLCLSKCSPGESCLKDTDCSSGHCSFGRCVGPSCFDAVLNGSETGLDCGGSCSPCPGAQPCLVNLDCLSGFCDGTAHCAPDSDRDSLKNGTETDVDCGGLTCSLCARGGSCAYHTDCASGLCAGGTCLAAATCNNGTKDGLETDIDCDGGNCPLCAFMRACSVNSDCISNTCLAGLCGSCPDSQLNGHETDVDCGGPVSECATRCMIGEMCFQDSDCQSNSCDSITNICN